MSTPGSKRGYMSQLDGLRFFAIMGVLVAHNWRPAAPWVFRDFPWGEMGVRLFFVLSGFLITGILIRGRGAGERNGESRLFLMRQFYIRRFLRIFPIYYLVLVVVVIAGLEPARQIWPWLFGYASNIYIWHHVHWIGHEGHFWTLAVEEQFYIVWPLLLLFLSRRFLVPLLCALILLAPAYRLYASFHYSSDALHGAFASGTLTIAVLDSLGLGALLAIAARGRLPSDALTSRLRRVALPIGAIGLTALLVLWHYDIDRHGPVALDQTAEALICLWLVGTAAWGFAGAFGRLLEWGPIAHLGKISYGIYLFHPFVPLALAAAATRVGFKYPETGFLSFTASSLLTFAVAALSWHFFEAPINRLKRHFPYRGDVGPSRAPAVVPSRSAQTAKP
jgi:peptidoglycan/LPS O-acetylase OafA/YrhL